MAVWLQPVIDAMIAGVFLGETALDALVIASTINFMLMLCSSFILVGGKSRATWHIGRGDMAGRNGVFSFCMSFFIILGIVLGVVGGFCSQSLALLFGSTEELLPMVNSYVQITCLGSIFFFINSVLLNFAILQGKKRECCLSIVLMTAINCVLDIVLVTAAGLGLAGLAVATVLGYIIGNIYLFTVIRKTDIKYTSACISMSEIGTIISQGLPFTIGCLGIFIRAIIFNNMVVSFGIAAMVTGMAIQNALNGWLSAPTAGCAEITSMMTGMFYGEGERLDLKKIMMYGLRSGFLTTSIFAILIFILAPFIVSAYQVTEGADICILAIQTFCVKLIIGASIWIFGLYYSVVGLIRMSLLINIVEPLLFPVLLAFPLIALVGYNGFWYIYIVADVLTILLIAFIVAARHRKWPFHLDLFMFLSKILPSKPCQTFNVSINNDIYKAVKISEEAATFCMKNGISKQRSFHIALCIEEMCANILSKDADGSRVHYIDLKLSISPDEIVYRMKNDGVAYNPFSEIKMNPDPIAGLGIKLVEQLAQSIDYHYEFNMNIISLKW